MKIVDMFLRGRKFWKESNLYVLVFVSLILQIVLFIFGNWRKYTSIPWIRSVLFFAYSMAVSVPTVALGVISNNLDNALDNNCSSIYFCAAEATGTFWAPFLLLHLGGPETITAYSLEINEHWQFLRLGVQATMALYIFLIAGFALSIPSIMMFLAVLIKYVERTWVLRSASNEQIRDSMLTRSKCKRECALKKYENIALGHYLFQNFKCLFVDLTLDFDDWYNSRLIFKEISCDKAFKVIEIELGFMYDVLYTKATVIHSRLGWCLRIITFSLTFVVMVLVLISASLYGGVDLYVIVTFLLICVAALLELYAIVSLLSSDWTRLWLSKHRKTPITRALSCLQLPEQRRWPNTISQFNLLSASLKQKPTSFYRIQKLLCIHKVLKKPWYKRSTHKEVTEDLKQLIFQRLREKFQRLEEISDNAAAEIKTLCSYRGDEVLKKYNFPGLDRSINIEFHQSIIIWHVATDLCYHVDDITITNTERSKCELSQLLSQYMMYLQVVCRCVSPVGSGLITFHDTRADVKTSCEGHNLDKSELCKKLLENDTEVSSSIRIEGDTSKSVLLKACQLASELQAISDIDQKWEMISNVWVEMLAYAACQLTGTTHAQQLKSGGEFLTHVWLLMSHFGLNEQFDIQQHQLQQHQQQLQQQQLQEATSPPQAVVSPSQVGSPSTMGTPQLTQQTQQQQAQASPEQLSQRTPMSPQQMSSGGVHAMSAGHPDACPDSPQLSSQTLGSVGSITNSPMDLQGVNKSNSVSNA